MQALKLCQDTFAHWSLNFVERLTVIEESCTHSLVVVLDCKCAVILILFADCELWQLGPLGKGIFVRLKDMWRHHITNGVVTRKVGVISLGHPEVLAKNSKVLIVVF